MKSNKVFIRIINSMIQIKIIRLKPSTIRMDRGYTSKQIINNMTYIGIVNIVQWA